MLTYMHVVIILKIMLGRELEQGIIITTLNIKIMSLFLFTDVVAPKPGRLIVYSNILFYCYMYNYS